MGFISDPITIQLLQKLLFSHNRKNMVPMKMKHFKMILWVCLVLIHVMNAQAQHKSQQKEQHVKITTDFGEMIIKLYNDTPRHRDNFIKNVKEGLYNGALFHRVMPGFMMQGGDPASVTATATQSLGRDNCPQLENEIKAHYFHKKGALSAARLPDASNPNRKSSGCQFFIVQGYKYTDAQLSGMETDNYKFPEMNRAYYKTVGGAPFLDWQYTIFGEVVEGFEVIDLIHAMRTSNTTALKDRPLADVKMYMELL